MKVGDLVAKRSDDELYKQNIPPLKTVVRVIRSREPRLHGLTPYYITLDDDPSKWEDPSDYFIVSQA